MPTQRSLTLPTLLLRIFASVASPGYVPTTPWSVIQQLTASTIDVPPASNGLQAFATYLGSGATVVSVGVIGNASPDVLGSFRGDTFGKTYGAAVGGGVFCSSAVRCKPLLSISFCVFARVLCGV